MSLRSLAIASLACISLASSAAHAMYLPPDLVQVPIERLVTNLERDLAAVTDKEGRVRLLIALGRLHAAAWASKMTTVPVNRGIQVDVSDPVVVKGKLTVDTAREVLAPIFGWRRNLLAALAEPVPVAAEFGCDPSKFENLLELTGAVTLRVTTQGAKKSPVVKATTSTLTNPDVERCLAARIATAPEWRAVPTKSVVDYTFTVTMRAGEGLRPFYGFGESPTPRVENKTATDAEIAAAKVHLEAARARYYEAVMAEPETALAHLGLAWTLEQLGKLPEAVTCYRKTFKRAWAVERELKHLGLGTRPLAVETAGYLIPLLDPEKDKAEIAEIQAATEKLERLPRPVTPIVIPLAADATLASVIAPDAGVAFDLDGSGRKDRWGWLTPRAGWLVYDQTGAGRIDSALQLFGSASFLCPWDDGYQALAALDDDGDGALAGPELAHLGLWVDADMDGVSDPGEVQPLAAHGIAGLETRASRAADGVLGHSHGVVMADGTTRPSWDWVVAPAQPQR